MFIIRNRVSSAGSTRSTKAIHASSEEVASEAASTNTSPPNSAPSRTDTTSPPPFSSASAVSERSTKPNNFFSFKQALQQANSNNTNQATSSFDDTVNNDSERITYTKAEPTSPVHESAPRNAPQNFDNYYGFDDSASVVSAEDKLKDFQQTLDMICQSAMDPVIIIDESGKIKSVNAETLQFFEYELWEVAAKNISMLMPSHHAVKHNSYLERYKSTKVKRIIGQVRTDIKGLKKNKQEVSIKLKVNEIRDQHGTVFLGMIKDSGRDEELMKIRDMLSRMLPKGYEEKITMGKMVAEQYKTACIMFVDLVRFTEYSSTAEPWEIISILNEIFESFDNICRPLEVEKIKTIGDCYMAAAGCTKVIFDAPVRIIEAALKMAQRAREIGKFKTRTGIGTGRVISGVLKGEKLSFDIWGDSVNIAARMESLAPVGGIRVCPATYKQTKFLYNYSQAEKLEVKGKGLMKTYVLHGRRE